LSERDESRRDEVEIDEDRGFFMISVAAELADMHPQTLRIYEAKGLITPKRSPRNTRLYSKRDVERLKRIQRLTSENGLNLAGVEAVLEMEARFAEMRDELERMRSRARELERRLTEEVDRPKNRRIDSHTGRGLALFGIRDGANARADLPGDIGKGQVAAQTRRLDVGTQPLERMLNGMGRRCQQLALCGHGVTLAQAYPSQVAKSTNLSLKGQLDTF